MTKRFHLGKRLPPYVFKTTNELKAAARSRGEDIVDLGMGNPDLPTPEPIVQKLIEAAQNPRNHRYSVSRGIPRLREAIARRCRLKWNIDLDPESEVVVTLGAKEGLAHLVLSILGPGEAAVVPEPAYPIHIYSVIIAGGRLVRVPMQTPPDLLHTLARRIEAERPRLLILSFPNNPTGMCVEIEFFEEIVQLARRYDVIVCHDFAYSDIVFDEYHPPSILQVPGAREIAVEFYSLSKSHSMAGWRVGFCVGNRDVVGALTKVKSYLDYGMFQPVQIASIIALNECEHYVGQIAEEYRKRRDVLVEGLQRVGWGVEKPKGTMFVWAPIPASFREMGSLEFSNFLLDQARVGVSPGIGFGESGEGFVRFALVENEQRIRQAVRGIRRAMPKLEVARSGG